ncbi:MAG: dephospho-CoA kinase [Puniceicoccales bacterium]|nr:dephospho-CoA kinase [Puniceicoccales bacterium]
MFRRIMRIALTGGIACGKSTAASFFGKHGCRVISTDALARELMESPPIIEHLRERFGAGIFGADGSVSRHDLGEIIFADKRERLWLENLLHPAINARWIAQVDAGENECWVVEIPLLFEKKLETHFDFSICVHCADSTQMSRMAARGLDAREVECRLRAQWSLEEKMHRATVCLFNEGTPLFLEQQICALLACLPQTPPFTFPSTFYKACPLTKLPPTPPLA